MQDGSGPYLLSSKLDRMNSKATTPEIREVLHAVHYMPSVSIIMPFEPKMNPKTEISQALKVAADKVEREVRNDYPAEMADLVVHKLKTIYKTLNFNTHKKSIAIYVSPVFEKVLYLDIAVEEKIIVDESFEIRDLVFSKKQLHKYLVLVLTEKEYRVYLGNSDSFVRIVSNTPESVYAYINEVPEKVANFTDENDRKEIIMDKFLRHIDNSLGIILNAYHLPLFVIGTERISGHFNKLTRHSASVIDYIHGSYGDASIEELKKVLKPHVSDWEKLMQKDILNQIEDAKNQKRLATGIHAVWHEASGQKGMLLVIEKGYMYPAMQDTNQEIYPPSEPYNKFSYIKDAVDDVIEKVLESGGDVEFVDQGLLEGYERIVLVKYY